MNNKELENIVRILESQALKNLCKLGFDFNDINRFDLKDEVLRMVMDKLEEIRSK